MRWYYSCVRVTARRRNARWSRAGGMECIVVIQEPGCVTEGPEGDNPKRRRKRSRASERTRVTTPLANSAALVAKVHFLESRLAAKRALWCNRTPVIDFACLGSSSPCPRPRVPASLRESPRLSRDIEWMHQVNDRLRDIGTLPRTRDLTEDQLYKRSVPLDSN